MNNLSDQRARRRHQLGNNFSSIEVEKDLNQSFSSNDLSDVAKKQQSIQRVGFSGFLPASNSFSGFSQQIWNTAQSLADQFQQQREQTPSPHPIPVELHQEDGNIFDPFQVIEMPYRDRTSEFRTVCKSYEMKIMANGRVQNRDERNKLVQSSIEFNQRAKRIGRHLSITCAKMEKLTELAKKKSLFDDPALQIERLSKEVQEDITGLNNQIMELSHLLQARYSNVQGSDHSKLVVVGLQTKLASVGKNFKAVLDIRTQNLKAKKNNREKYCQAEPVPSSMPQSRSNVLLIDDATSTKSQTNGGSYVLEMDQLQLQEQSPLLDNTDTYYRDRLGAMENIESSISQLGQIFSQLAHLVQEQGEMIARIDSNVEHTSINVEAAHHELLKYFNNISKNRWLIIKVFGVLLVFIVFFIIFMA